jgi:hypothetical protein
VSASRDQRSAERDTPAVSSSAGAESLQLGTKRSRVLEGFRLRGKAQRDSTRRNTHGQEKEMKTCGTNVARQRRSRTSLPERLERKPSLSFEGVQIALPAGTGQQPKCTMTQVLQGETVANLRARPPAIKYHGALPYLLWIDWIQQRWIQAVSRGNTFDEWKAIAQWRELVQRHHSVSIVAEACEPRENWAARGATLHELSTLQAGARTALKEERKYIKLGRTRKRYWRGRRRGGDRRKGHWAAA